MYSFLSSLFRTNGENDCGRDQTCIAIDLKCEITISHGQVDKNSHRTLVSEKLAEQQRQQQQPPPPLPKDQPFDNNYKDEEETWDVAPEEQKTEEKSLPNTPENLKFPQGCDNNYKDEEETWNVVPEEQKTEEESLSNTPGNLKLPQGCDNNYKDEEESWDVVPEEQKTEEKNLPNDTTNLSRAVIEAAKARRVVVIDIQCFKDNTNGYIAKELAAIELTTNNGDFKIAAVKTVLWTTIQPPFGIDNLSDLTYKQYKYTSQCYHGLSWEEGTVTCDDAFNLLRTALCENGVHKKDEDIFIFVKGPEKVKYISNKVPYGVVMEYGGPSLRKMQLPRNTPLCPAHSKMSKDFACSLNNCYKIAANFCSSYVK